MLRLFCLALVAGASLPTLTVLAAEAPAKTAAIEKAPVPAEAGGSDEQATLKTIDEIGKRGESAQAEVPLLLKLLSDKRENLRWHAARALGAIGPAASDAVPTLIQALSDEVPNVRAYAAFALGRIGKAAEPAVEKLIEAVFDKDAMVRRTSARALRDIGPVPEKAFPILEKALEEADPALIQLALATMSERGQEAVPRLQQFLKRKKLAYWACLVLANIGPEAAAAVPDLVAVLQAEEAEVRLHALLALGNIGAASKPAVPAIVGLLEKDPFEGVRYAAVYALVQVGEHSDAINAALADAAKHKDPLLNLLGLWGLAKLNPKDEELAKAATEAIVENLVSPDQQLRQAAARALHEFHGPPEIVRPALIAALKDADPEVVSHALDALASLGPKALTNLDQALQDKQLRHYATRLIFRLGEQAVSAVPALVQALQQPTENEDDIVFRREVQFTLAAIGPAAKEAIPELIKSLDSKDEEVFGTACYALGKIGPAAKDAVSVLRKTLNDRQDADRAAIVWALLKILPDSPNLRKFAAPLLVLGLNSDRDVVRAECAASLGDLGVHAKPAITRLEKLLEDDSPLVRDAATGALKKLGKSE